LLGEKSMSSASKPELGSPLRIVQLPAFLTLSLYSLQESNYTQLQLLEPSGQYHATPFEVVHYDQPA
jgi:hypothetical protein